MDFTVVDNSDAVLMELKKKTAMALEAIGLQAERNAKLACTVDTGRLRNSISHAVNGDTAYIGTNVEYAPYVELGHHQEPGRYVPKIKKRLKKDWVPPKPFLKPAIEKHTSEYKKIAQQYMKF